MAAAVEIAGLTLRFGGVSALRGLDLALTPGETVGLIGPNGSGKTSLFNVVTGHHAPDAGRIRLNHREISGMSPNRIAGLGVARTFQNLRLLRRLSIRENLRAARHAAAPWLETLWQSPAARRLERERLTELLDLFGLAEVAEEMPDSLTLVQMRQLEIARVLAAKPQLVLLDEPAAGMTPAETDGIAAAIAEHLLPGRSAIIIEHKLNLVTALCPRIAVLDAGRKIADGIAADVLSSSDVRRSYFGSAPC